MSHFLTRLVDRTIGSASTIEPVCSPVFMGASLGHSESGGHEAAGFAYGDLVKSTPILPQQTRIDTGDIADSASREREEEKTPVTTVQPLDSHRMDAMSVPDVSEPVTQGWIRQNQENDVTVSPARETTRPAVQTETLTTEPGTRATERVPMTSYRALITKEQPNNNSVNPHLRSHLIVDKRETVQIDAASRQSGSSEPLTQVNPDSLLRPRVLPASSFSTHQTIINSLKQDTVQPQSPQPPTIQVTIGRIEVRAVTTPPPLQVPQARKKSQPSLSLDDYLKQRSGGQR